MSRLLFIHGRALLLALGLILINPALPRAEISEREGWVVLPTQHSYQELIARVEQAANANQIGVVTRASATVGAKEVLNKEIPGNMVIGLYHPRFAVPMLEASVAAGIEAPIRVYLTENEDGTATLSYKKPSFVFAPYMEEGSDGLDNLAAELDELFQAVAEQAAGT
jgi:uncharacterized protein (DUF302 family)